MVIVLLVAQILTNPVNLPSDADYGPGLGDPRRVGSIKSENQILCLTHKRTRQTICRKRSTWQEINRREEMKAKSAETKR